MQRVLGPLAIVSHVLGCASANHGAQYEYSPPEEIIARAIESQSAVVIVPVEKERYAWERVEYFVYELLKASSMEVNRNTASGEFVGIARSKNGGTFEIRKRLTDKGYRYSFACREGTRECTLQAKNLARFIEHGTFERRLLPTP